jgi:PIN domain nuclease of toxin-antitoxin system
MFDEDGHERLGYRVTIANPGDAKARLSDLVRDVRSVALAHAMAIADLPMHHTDPFDRMLIAQAQLEGMTLVSADPKATRYPAALLATQPV